MKYFCIDESGSFHTMYERYYIISGIVLSDLNILIDAHKKIEKEVRKSKSSTKELKAAKIKDYQKAMFINELINKDVNIVSLAIDKDKLKEKYDFDMSEFLIYNYALKELCKATIELGYINKNENLLIKVDNRSMNPKITNDLEAYLNLEFFDFFKRLRVEYNDSATTREIQMADYVSNTVYGFLNNTNEAYKELEDKRIINLKIIPKEKLHV